MPVELFDLDEDAHEMYVVKQKRVTVYDMDTGAFKRGWGGHGGRAATKSKNHSR